MKPPRGIARRNGRMGLRYYPPGPNTLLPSEPRIAQPTLAESQTARYLQPALAELEAFFLELRAELDPALRAAAPVKYGKPYPLSQCLEITLAIKGQLKAIDPRRLSPRARQGHQALSQFLAAGGTLRRVWGDLRGQYFQNALLIGSLYVDVANDTVVITKPKVEILPFHLSGLSPIRDYQHFARIAESYWQVSVWPNHVLPELAPAFPILTVTREGVADLQSLSDYMTALNWQQAFRPAETFLASPPMPEAVFAAIAAQLQNSPHRLATDPAEGRRLALKITQQYRKKRWHQTPETQQRLLAEGHEIRRHLSHAPIPGQPSEARKIMRHLEQTDAEIVQIQKRLAILQTARNAYAQALRAALANSVPE